MSENNLPGEQDGCWIIRPGNRPTFIPAKRAPATPEQHALVAEAIKARIGNVIPLPVADPASDFERQAREKLAEFEKAHSRD